MTEAAPVWAMDSRRRAMRQLGAPVYWGKFASKETLPFGSDVVAGDTARVKQKEYTLVQSGVYAWWQRTRGGL